MNQKRRLTRRQRTVVLRGSLIESRTRIISSVELFGFSFINLEQTISLVCSVAEANENWLGRWRKQPIRAANDDSSNPA